jgi:Fe-S oxidoreductase
LAQASLNELKSSGAKCLLVLTPGDQYAFTRLLTERLGIEWPKGIEIREVLSLLEEKSAEGSLNFKPSDDQRLYSYIDPTHSLRVPARHAAPRQLLARIFTNSGRELFWRKERSHPTGNGALQFTSPHISAHLTYSRLADAQQAGARVIISEDPGCLSHLKRHADRFELQVQGLYEILAGQLV